MSPEESSRFGTAGQGEGSAGADGRGSSSEGKIELHTCLQLYVSPLHTKDQLVQSEADGELREFQLLVAQVRMEELEEQVCAPFT